MEQQDYQAQGWDFLKRWSIGFNAKQTGSKCPPWDDGRCIHGDHYRITLTKSGPGPYKARFAFDFWNSLSDMQAGRTPQPYDVLAAISSEAAFDGSFADFCGEYGESEDSRKALALYNRVVRFATRAQKFFTPQQIEELQEVR